jgi:hypothetical protein
MKPQDQNDDASASLDQKLQSHIGTKLKQFYDEIVSETVPDRFKMLLDQLEKAETVVEDKTESNR